MSIVSFNTRDLINRSRTQVKKNTIVTQTNSYSPPENVSERNLQIAFKMSDFFAQSTIDDAYFGHMDLRQLVVKMETNETDGTKYRVFDYKSIPYTRC